VNNGHFLLFFCCLRTTPHWRQRPGRPRSTTCRLQQISGDGTQRTTYEPRSRVHASTLLWLQHNRNHHCTHFTSMLLNLAAYSSNFTYIFYATARPAREFKMRICVYFWIKYACVEVLLFCPFFANIANNNTFAEETFSSNSSLSKKVPIRFVHVQSIRRRTVDRLIMSITYVEKCFYLLARCIVGITTFLLNVLYPTRPSYITRYITVGFELASQFLCD